MVWGEGKGEEGVIEIWVDGKHEGLAACSQLVTILQLFVTVLYT